MFRSVARWHTLLVITVLAIAVAALSLMLPTPAKAATSNALTACVAIYPVPDYCRELDPVKYADSDPSYIGTAWIDANRCLADACTAVYRTSIVAYRWNKTTRIWVKTSLADRTRVYHYPFPYGGGWSWVHTWNTGWLLVRSGSVRISPWFDYYRMGLN